MKRFNLLFIVLAVFTLILAACGNNENVNENENNQNENTDLAYEPEDINPDTDICEVCGMAIADDQHATQIVLKNDRVLKFDDLGDLYVWLEENGSDDVGAKFVRDFDSKEWIQLEEATFIFDEEIATPMGFGVISFKDEADAKKYIEDNGFGELLTVADLNDHEWGSDHDHGDHGDHEGHGDHDEGHGFHTEGFDMHFTDLEHVTVSEEVELEVHLTMHDEALEGANVRYEVWIEGDKDQTQWIDAQEGNAGIYVADHIFEETGTYHIQIHVEDDGDLHEHMEYEVSVSE